ncbi:unnamed protein product [Heterobilharzia americana]|nr:unnamed protein product [Heterobilharzia americana]CAH8536173.1 unnamed protein product [Heterobilharzia americana]
MSVVLLSIPGTPTYNISRELSRKLKHPVQSCGHSIKSPTEFLENIKSINMENDELMISLDVTAPYTSIEPQLANETMSLQLTEDTTLSESIKLKCSSLMELTDLCLTTYFQFNAKIYKQMKETPMGSPKSGLIAKPVM